MMEKIISQGNFKNFITQEYKYIIQHELPSIPPSPPMTLQSSCESANSPNGLLKLAIFRIIKIQPIQLWLQQIRCPNCKQKQISKLIDTVGISKKRICIKCDMSFEEKDMIDKQYSRCQLLKVVQFGYDKIRNQVYKLLVPIQYTGIYQIGNFIQVLFIQKTFFDLKNINNKYFAGLQPWLVAIKIEIISRPTTNKPISLFQIQSKTCQTLYQQYILIKNCIQNGFKHAAPEHTYFTAKIAMWLMTVTLAHSFQSPFYIKIICQDIGIVYKMVKSIFNQKAILISGQLDNEAIAINLAVASVVVCIDQQPSWLEQILQKNQTKISGYTIKSGCSIIVLKNPSKKRGNPLPYHIIADVTHQSNYQSRQIIHDIQNVVDYLLEQATQQKRNVIVIEKTKQKDSTSQASSILLKLDTAKQNFYQLNSLRLLQNYFLKSRQNKRVNAIDFQLNKHVCQLLAIGRHSLGKGIGSIQVIDVILGIFLDQQTSRNKYGSQELIFGHEASRVLLHNWQKGGLKCLQMSYGSDIMHERQGYITHEQKFKDLINKVIRFCNQV